MHVNIKRDARKVNGASGMTRSWKVNEKTEEWVVELEDGKWWYGVLAQTRVTQCLSGL